MINTKYLLVLLVLIAAIVGYSLLPKTQIEPLDENQCKELLLQHDSSVPSMTFFTSGRETHIDNSIENTTMRYNITGGKQVFFVFGDVFEGCGISTDSENLLKGNYKQYVCNRETAKNLFVETKDGANYFYANYKVIFEDGVTGKIVYMQPEFKDSFMVNVIYRAMNFYGCG